MKKKTKVLASALLTIAMSASLVAGGTYALFTSESAINVAVSSGTVSVVATLDEDKGILLGSTLDAGKLEETQADYAADTNVVSLTNMVPGDYMEFDINVHNASTVAVKYQTVISVVEDDGLFDGLDVYVDGALLEGSDAKMSKWQTMQVGAEDITVPVRIELPVGAGNEYQNKTCTIAYKVNAVQGNAETYDPVPKAGITDLTEDQKLVESNEISSYVSSLVKDGATFDIVAGQSYSIQESLSEIRESQYKDWIADFEISFDKDITYTFVDTDGDDSVEDEIIPATADLLLIGEYGSIGWVPLPVVVPAMVNGGSIVGTETADGYQVTLRARNSVRALGDLLDLAFPGVAFTYYDIASVVKVFNCGIVLDGSGIVTTLSDGTVLEVGGGVPPTGTNVTVELKLYEAVDYEEVENGVVKTVDTYTAPIEIQTASAEAMEEALEKGLDVTLTEDVTVESGVATDKNGNTEAYGNKIGVAQYGGTLDGNGNSIETGEDYAWTVITHGGTIKNLTFVDGGRGIVLYSPTEDVYVDNCVIDGPGYAINTAEHPTVEGIDLIVTNSTLNGWTSFAGIASASFTNCSFGENTTKYWQGMGYDQDYDRSVRPYVTTTFTDCQFEQDFCIDLSALGADCTITLENCTVNGKVLTAANYTQYITIELPSGRTVADCVIFK